MNIRISRLAKPKSPMKASEQASIPAYKRKVSLEKRRKILILYYQIQVQSLCQQATCKKQKEGILL